MGPFITTGLYLVFQLFYVAFLMIFQFIVLFWFIGRPRIYWLMPGETGVGFQDYKGNPEVLESAKQVVTLLKGVKRFKMMGGQPIRGLLLEGPPGTGKSYLGQAIASEAQLPFGYMSAPSIQGMFWGMDTLRVLSLYNKARKLARKHGACILFIDEIDAIGKSRSGTGNAGGMGGMMFGGGGGALNELLNQMDPLPKDGWKDKLLRMFGMRKGKAEQPPVLTIAATNLVSVLDAALLRPGRFDRQIRIGAPSYDGRKEIFDYYLGQGQARRPADRPDGRRDGQLHAGPDQAHRQRGGRARGLERPRRDRLRGLPLGAGDVRVGPAHAGRWHELRRQATPGVPRGWTRRRGGQAAQA